MPKFAANLTMLYTELPFMERFQAAANSGFEFVEYLFPYQWPAEQLAEALTLSALQQVLFNLPPGDWDSGERGIAGLPGREEEFKQGVDTAIEYALALDVKQLNCLSGLKQDQYSDEQHWNTLVANVKYAAKKLAAHNITLMVEAINSRVDMPGFLLDTLDKTQQLIKEVGEPNVRIQFDIYHMQIMHGDVIRRLESYQNEIGHIQFADNPGRHEPGTGELNFPVIFEVLDKIGYTGYVSAEYIPEKSTEESLNWLTKL
jgi:hydroxypyruvate isomerase